MAPIAWRHLNDWKCTACGICCKEYAVVLRFNEWLNIIKLYGIEATVPGLNRVYLKRRSDGSCIFLKRLGGFWICSLQDYLKPQACRIWPFKIYTRPRYGQEKQAIFPYDGRKFYVYVDPACLGIRWGQPSRRLVERVIPEFIQMACGQTRVQHYSTANLNGLFIQRIRPRI